MNCRDTRHAIVLEHYGELSADELGRLDAHLQSCPACAADREETREVLALVSAEGPIRVPDFDRERSWRYVRAELRDTRRRTWFPLAPGWRWGLAGAGIAMAIVLGVVIGRLGLKPPLEPPTARVEPLATEAPNAPSIKPVLVTHIEDLQPILLDFANSVSGGTHAATITVDERLLRALLLQNLLLRRALAGKDPAAAELLEDLDLVLKEIVNNKGPGSASQAQIRDLIREREILFRIRILEST